MILAGIDIGTNTIRLLVARMGRGTFQEIESGRTITRLGQGMERTGMIAPEAEERSAAALGEFVRQARGHAPAALAAVGTSALREARNAAAFIARTRDRLGLDVRVVTGEEEARLTLLGVAAALRSPGDPGRPDVALVIDVGGGSTELIRTRSLHGPAEASLPLGAVNLTERFLHHDPVSREEIAALREHVAGELRAHEGMIRPVPAGSLVGTAGTITTLAAVDREMDVYVPAEISGHVLTGDALDRIVRLLSAGTLSERRAIKGLEPGREDIILAGAVVVQEIMRLGGHDRLLVSDWGLREGIVLDLYEQLGSGRRFPASPSS